MNSLPASHFFPIEMIFLLFIQTSRPTIPGSPAVPEGGDMDITSIGSSGIARNIAEMGDLLKDITNTGMGLEKKLMTASVTEMVENPALGNGIDVSA